MNPDEVTRLYQRIIKDENDISLLLSRPIPTDYGSVLAKLNQDIIHLQEVVKAQQAVLEAHGSQLLALSKPKPFYKLF